MNKRYTYILLLLLITTGLKAQPEETIYLGNTIKSGYAINESYGPFEIGFNFNFFGTPQTQFYVSSNGLVTFGSGTIDNTEDPIPTPGTPNNFIAPFWDELVVNPFGNILYTTIGAAPSRKLIIQFRNMSFFTEPSYMGTFAVILYETTDKIQVQYRTIILKNNDRARGGSATIGIENSTGLVGSSYAYHITDAVSSGKAVSFNYTGSAYNINTDDMYEGVYLTTNLTLPEPGITEMINPANNSIVGTDVVFEWAASTYATNYSIEIATNPNLLYSSIYNAGSNLTYSISGLIPNTTYYWLLLMTNATGKTWNEIMSFNTSPIPPIFAVPRTLWVEQGSEKEGKLQYTGGDASAKTAIVTSLPLQGKLYQVSGGLKSTLINTVPTIVSDPGFSLIYVADGTFGNGAGNFNFKFQDDTGDSPEATITINVSPLPIPNLLYTGKATTYVEMQFDRIMANPSGNESNFIVTVNGTPRVVTTLALKTGDPNTIVATFSPSILITDAVTIAYNAGTVASAQGGWLASFSAITIILKAQTISFTTNLTKKLNESPFPVSATSSSGLTSFTYSSSNLSVATITGTSVTLRSVGTSNITARQAGNGTWAPARYPQTLTVAKGDQTITFNVLPDKTYGDGDYLISASSNSGLTVSFASDNPAVATVTGNSVHIVGAGTTVITASQAGNTQWNPATSVLRTLIVKKAEQIISFDVLSDKTFADPDYSISASSSSGLSVVFASDNNDVATVTGNTVHIFGAGETIITASQTGNANYNAAPVVEQTLTVTKLFQTITFTNTPERLLVTDSYTLVATSSAGIPILYESTNDNIATVTGNQVTGVEKGIVQVRAYNEGDDNYDVAEDFASIEVYSTHRDILYLFTPNDDGFNDLWELPEMSTWGNCDVKVYNRWGKLVYANKNYNNQWDGMSEGNPVPEGAYYFVIETENNGMVKGTVNIIR